MSEASIMFFIILSVSYWGKLSLSGIFSINVLNKRFDKIHDNFLHTNFPQSIK